MSFIDEQFQRDIDTPIKRSLNDSQETYEVDLNELNDKQLIEKKISNKRERESPGSDSSISLGGKKTKKLRSTKKKRKNKK